MKKFLFSLVFILSAAFIYAQTAPLVVYNSSPQPMYVWVGASTTCTGPYAASAPVLIPVNGMNSFAPLAGPGASWIGIRAAASIIPFSPPFGSFYNPCFSCGADTSIGLNVSWDTLNGCFAAKIY